MPMAGAVFAALIAASAAAGAPAPQGGLAVAPLTLELGPRQHALALNVSNPGDAPIQAQVRIYAWSNAGLDDKYAPTADLALSPALFPLEPHAHQVVRIVLQSPRGATETAYRLFVDQLPLGQPGAGVTLPVRMVLPVFVAAEEGEPASRVAKPQIASALTWRADRQAGDGPILITAANPGHRRVKVVDLGYLAEGRVHPIAPGLSGYVLAGQQRQWAAPEALGPGSVTLVARTEFGDLRSEVLIPAR